MNGMDTRGRGKARLFTPRMFLHTGREMVVEIRGSLHTGRGKIGFAAFALGILIGIHGSMAYQSQNGNQDHLLFSALWCAMGLVVLLNLQNHKLLYLLPATREEFAAAQMRKMAWTSLIILIILTAGYACIGHSAGEFLWCVAFKGIPVSISFGGYQIASAQPIKGSMVNGVRIYRLSFLVLLLNCGAAYFNLLFVVDSWNAQSLFLPILNYGICVYATVYLYRKIAYADLYYDELWHDGA